MTAPLHPEKSTPTPKHSLVDGLQDNSGNSLLEAALVVPFLILILVAAIDFGRAYYVGIQLASATHAGALYGMQKPTDIAGIVTAANLSAASVTGITTSATFGCECSDGTSVVVGCKTGPVCTYNVLNYVDVISRATYTPLLNYPGIPASIPMKSEARIRSAQ
jgi:Flp pilus assembly protein TadG